MCGLFAYTGERHLVGAPVALNFMAVHFLRAGPAFGAAQDDHGPTRTSGLATLPVLVLNVANFQNTLFHRPSHLLMHQLDVITFHEMRRPSVTPEQALQLFVRYAR